LVSLNLILWIGIELFNRDTSRIFVDKSIEKEGHIPIMLMPPKSYLDFLALWRNASLVLTDSGRLQEETTALGIPCFTIRENTERPITIEEGTNTLVGTTAEKILGVYKQFKGGYKKSGKIPQLWDGKTAERVIKILIANEG
jgi:UDP-N-acetylglucosamine 2-epimerase (non-hydrolysing)